MSFLQRKTLTAALILVLAWVGYRGWQIHGEKAGLAAQVGDLNARVADLRQNNDFLASSSAYFASDAYLERQARLKLNYKLPDEQVAFVYPDAGSRVVSASASPTLDIATMPNWKKWWYYLLGYHD